MARELHKLSAITVKNETKPGRHRDGGGLILNVGATGSKSWTFMWVRDGKKREAGLGSYPAVGLAAARERAAECRTIVAAGGDPIAERDKAERRAADEAEAAKTFGDVADLYIKSIESEWRNAKHEYQWRQTLGDSYCKKLRPMPIADITVHDVLEVLEPIWRDKQETASRLRGRMERVFDFARVKGWRGGENPALWRGLLKNILPKRQKLQRGHLPAMKYEDVPAFVQRIRGAEALAARALELAILTACRSNEVLGAKWDEVDFKAGTWTIPPERTKTAEKHEVPLSTRASELLETLHETRTSEFIFPSAVKPKQPLSNMAMLMFLRRLKMTDITVHGFRSAFRDWAGDATDHPREVAEAALAHRVGNEVERAYRRSSALEKRRLLMEDWSEYLSHTGAELAEN